MSMVADIKRFILRALKPMEGQPMSELALDDAVRMQCAKAPMQHEITEARMDLEREGYIHGQRDDLDPNLNTWTLTPKGEHRAALLK